MKKDRNNIDLRKNTLLILTFFMISQVSFCQDKFNFFEYQKEKEAKIINSKYVEFEVDSISNSNLLNKITIMNFWYEGCAPCIAEMDALNRLYENNKENKKFQFISFCVDDIETIDKNKEKFNIEYTVIPIERTKAYMLNYQSGFPVTIIIDTVGKVIHYSSGGSTDKLKATEKVINVYDKIIGKELQKAQ